MLLNLQKKIWLNLTNSNITKMFQGARKLSQEDNCSQQAETAAT